MILKYSKEAIESDINARGLNHLRFKGLYFDSTVLNLSGDIAITQQHGWRPYRLCQLET
jgi:hypothetical protein